MADEKNRRPEDEPTRQGDVLGLSDTPIAEREAAPRDPVGGPEPPPGLHVEN